ncbi:MAG TPA: hypothetical protein VNS09_23990 [Solirubrobacter sp.]|nr:hypothetical protein [Solirubrobacter sp.]
MNAIKDTWSALVRRRLWPVAVLLVAALAAVPVVLAKTPEPAPPAPAPKVAADDTTVGYVTLASAPEPESPVRRRVLGARKDPFAPRELPKRKKKAKAEATATPTATAKPETSGGGGGATSPVSPTPTATPAPSVPAFTVRVRFGTTDGGDLKESFLERLSPLPDDESPVVVYRGLENGGRVALFELTGDVDAQGDGTCVPTPEDCQYLKLHAGETEFITVTDTGDETDAQYQLDLVKIYTKRTALTGAAAQALGEGTTP